MPLRARGREEGGGSATRVSTSLIRVRYAETDQMGVAYHGGYFAWFEVGRTDLLRSRGMTYKNLEAADLRLPVIETGARYLRPVFYDDVIEIPWTIEPLQPILAVVPTQLLAYHIALRRGCDVDQPRNLAKSVTVE